MNIYLQSNGLAERARKSKERSQELKIESEITKDRVRDGNYQVLIYNFLQRVNKTVQQILGQLNAVDL